ncbi:MAG: SDR family oxidoreductase [Actinomycetota bacterium]
MELNGAIAVVTGASAGIGEATAIALARRGATVVLAARRSERLDDLAARIEARGGRALALRCDVTDLSDVRSLAAAVEEAFGRCDVLVNNAGIPGEGTFTDLDFDAIERVVRVNELGLFWTTKAFLPMMLRAGRGHVVNVASLAGRFAVPGSSVYSATKHAVVAFSEALHYELAPRGVLVTTVNPGPVPTEGFPQTGRPRQVVTPVTEVADLIVDVVRRGRAPEVSIPRWVASLQLFRVLTPRLYRWGVRTVTARRFRPRAP